LVLVAESSQILSSYKKIGSVGRIMTQRSPGRNTFENADDSDDDGTQLSEDNWIPFYPVTRDSSNSYVRIMLYCLLRYLYCFFGR
jgi:hypothetical protein